MLKPHKPDNEVERLLALQALAILDTPREEAYQDLLNIAAAVCGVPRAAVSLIDTDRQWFKARIGIDAAETPRGESFCGHAILTPDEVMTVPDARLDPRFQHNPWVIEKGVRFYAGAPLVTREGHALGAICVMDNQPRTLDAVQQAALKALSRQVMQQIELKRIVRQLNHHHRERDWYEEQLIGYQSELESQCADLSQQARTDPLTGLANRRAFAIEVDAAIARDDQVVVAVLDIDHFKTVNDTHGHAKGDELLCIVAQVLRDCAGEDALVARFGGEEFVWLWQHVDLETARRQCDELRMTVAHATQALPVTVSIGVTTSHPGESAQDLFVRADALLYRAKASGRDRVEAAS